MIPGQITAKEARDRAESTDNEKTQACLHKAFKSIAKAADDGKRQVFLYEYPTPQAKKRLQELGYTIGTNQGINDVCIPISWVI